MWFRSSLVHSVVLSPDEDIVFYNRKISLIQDALFTILLA